VMVRVRFLREQAKPDNKFPSLPLLQPRAILKFPKHPQVLNIDTGAPLNKNPRYRPC
jgi:hypothetical protein